jgi:hypothetical protein
MLYVSIVIELVRSRSAAAVWMAACAQGAIWALVPSWFYSGPPGNVTVMLAIGHEFPLATPFGGPLAFWLAEFAFDATGHSLFGVYVLSQACVVLTYWAIFALGRTIVGGQHAALAVLLMVGISTFTLATPDFGPAVLAMPIWAFLLLHYWQAVGLRRPKYWIAVGVEIGLLLLTTYGALLLILLLVLFTLANDRGRAALASSYSWLAGLLCLIALVPHLLWLTDASGQWIATLTRLRAPDAAIGSAVEWLRQIAWILISHLGLFALAGLVIGFGRMRVEPAPVIVRGPVKPFAGEFVYFFALAPAALATFAGAIMGLSDPVGGLGPLVVLSGLALVVAGGDIVKFGQQRLTICAWSALLILPPVLAVAALSVAPWIGIDLAVSEPAEPIARFFADSFQRRVGTPLRIVAGDTRTAALVALGSPSRPSVLFDAAALRSPWVTMDDVQKKGAIVVWPTTDTSGTPPPPIQERFPDIVPEVPRDFKRAVRGELPLLRIGWALIRPQASPPPTSVTPPANSASAPK